MVDELKNDIMPEPPEPEDATATQEEIEAIVRQLQEGGDKSEDASRLDQIVAQLEQTEREIGVEYVGPGKGMNRKARREADRILRRVTRRPMAYKTLKHPILDTLTPYGAKRLKRRRAKNRVARASRKVNRETAS